MESEILEKLDIYRRAEKGHKRGGEYIIEEVKEYMKGQGEAEARDQFYPGWTKEDFEKLLNLIERGN